MKGVALTFLTTQGQWTFWAMYKGFACRLETADTQRFTWTDNQIFGDFLVEICENMVLIIV